LSDVLVGYLDPTDVIPRPPKFELSATKVTSDEDDKEDKGPDPVEARKRFGALKRAYRRSQKTIATEGYASKKAQQDVGRLSVAFSPFKLVPRHYEEIVFMARDALSRLHRHERAIMSLCVREAHMPR
jgi:RNA polymerase primary sigma factor